ncbi:MAG: protein-(glutamine-N5) methyltransferase, release factor-specific [Bacteroidetes bacterium]|nr:MAG: protein-(glutamine-N5) methyltransferase, release factor-specific [Bacteroidota bacterium]PIE88126.1 MAG: protein-(glutamine-N5) methyltransferase, release factor-specific [Bacteroidota bacterium]
MTNPLSAYTLQQLSEKLDQALSPLYPPEERLELIRILMEESTGKSRAAILASPHDTVAPQAAHKILNALPRLAAHEPIQYILSKAWFYGLTFYVNRHTLIPRPETEELVSLALQAFQSHPKLPPSFLEAGTGSGCIAITLIHENSQLSGYAFDLNREALLVAKQNARLHQKELILFQDNMLQFSGKEMDQQVGMLLSNPPYVLPEEQKMMRKNVTEYEPPMALYAPQEDPLCYYKHLKDIAIKYLVKGGILLFEINEAMPAAMLQLFDEEPFRQGTILKDMRGKSRFFQCKKA